MMLLPKAPPRADKKRLAYIRTLACISCGAPPPSEAAHIRLGLAGGMGLKPADTSTVPLCDACHRLQHQIGEVKFWGEPIRLAKMLHRAARSL